MLTLARLVLVPETKGLSLEELDAVFSIPTARHTAYNVAGLRSVVPSPSLSSFSLALALTLSHPARSYNFRKYILRQRLPPREPLYAWEGKGQA